MDVTSAMRRAAAFFADREAVVHGADRLTFAAAWQRGCRLANGLIALGLRPGDRVAVLEDNSKEAADFFLGAGIANLVRVPLYPRYNIWPMELENAIAAHPGVMEVAVFGIPDTRWGETPCAVVVPKPGAQVGEADVIQVCVERLGSYKKPGNVVVREEPLPKTPVGKIKRRDLREPYWVGHPRRVAGS